MATAVDARTAAPEGAAPSTRRLEALATLLSCVGLLTQVLGYYWGWRGDEPTAIGLWYVGFVMIVVPFAWLLLAPHRTGHQRLGAALAFGLIMYGSWFLTDPVLSTRFDENLHVTTLVDLVEDAQFFHPNTMLPVSPHYPGLEFATAGVHWLTGLPLIVCQVLVVLTARSVFILALFLLASRIGRSTQVGAATVLLYAGSAQFYFFNSQFSYQTVAIAMLMAALYLVVRGFDSDKERPWSELVTAQVCLGGLAITHHLTSWLMLILLWALAFFFWRGGEQRRFRLTLITAEIGTVVVLAWTAIIAPLLISYLSPIFDVASSELLSVLDGGEGGRTPGAGSTSTPSWEVLVMFGSVALWCLMLLPAAFESWRRGSVGPTKARYVPLAIAVTYPALQLARFAPSAAEVADRASTFVLMAMALIVGAWLAPRLPRFAPVFIPGLLLLVLGGTLIGSGPDWQRVPGPYLAGAEQRSIDAETVAVAQWFGTYAPTDSRVAADSTFNRLLPNFAPVTTITQPAGFDSMTPLFIAHSVDEEVLRLVLQNDVDFIVVDTRMIGQSVRSGCFFEASCGYGADAMTMKRDQLEKFEGQEGFDLVLDGPVRVYDVRPLRHAAQDFEHRDPPGIPGSWTPYQVVAVGVLLLIGFVLRGRLLDPRRFRARDVWRPAVALPAAMVVGVVGVMTGFNPVAGVVAAAVLLYALVNISEQPEPLGRGRLASWAWGVPTTLIVLAAVGLATYAAYDGLLDHHPLPPPIVSST